MPDDMMRDKIIKLLHRKRQKFKSYKKTYLCVNFYSLVKIDDIELGDFPILLAPMEKMIIYYTHE